MYADDSPEQTLLRMVQQMMREIALQIMGLRQFCSERGPDIEGPA